ncbi:restriction endonuclease [Arthrobacter sp. zg-Y20]|uniref:HNH endonuclease n=1 Tax=unclassified Arthrobacter TaxID=235627 RepID=UPI001D14FB5E|nr:MULTISPECIES: restriction endonuclease [unclassified Arthrobacter]MCC3276696.1 restriction endonuclease [Arthrobacter sp. zg-Y20]MDK1316855.1 restriction endonuclease [Arthrobacter sp. zg.Y20]WIB06734.1 restriction endonuclease [Arthrobacter sp. zg-Y20]
MPSVLLASNVELPEPWPGGFAPAVAALAGGGKVQRRFGVAARNRVPVPAGTEVWLLQRGSDLRGPRGLVGHGTVPGPLASGGTTLEVDFDLLLPLGEQLPIALLLQRMPGLPWAGRAGLSALPDAAVPALRRIWSEFIGPQPDPVVPGPGSVGGQWLRQQHVNRFEQDAEARRVCLAFHGDACAACGLDPASRYGAAGAGVIQVHLLVPGPDLAEDYRLDPVSDLVPLCPTCHAVAHTRVPDPLTPAEVRGLLAASGEDAGTGPGTAVVGRVVSARQLQAQEDADRLRGFR